MKTKIFGLALMLSLAAVLGACEGGEPGGTTATPAATGEPGRYWVYPCRYYYTCCYTSYYTRGYTY